MTVGCWIVWLSACFLSDTFSWTAIAAVNTAPGTSSQARAPPPPLLLRRRRRCCRAAAAPARSVHSRRACVACGTQTAVLGTILFNFALCQTVPSWVNEKRPEVSVNKSIW